METYGGGVQANYWTGSGMNHATCSRVSRIYRLIPILSSGLTILGRIEVRDFRFRLRGFLVSEYFALLHDSISSITKLFHVA